MSFLENCKVLSSLIWSKNSQLLRVPWKNLTTEMVISSFIKKIIPKFSEKFWGNPKKRHISKTTKFWADVFRGKIFNPMKVPSQISITGLRISKFWNFLTSVFFFQNFGENHKKRHILKTTRIWAVVFGGKNRNSWEYPDKASPPRWEYQNLWFFLYLMFWNFFLNPKKNVITRTTRIWLFIYGGQNRKTWENSDSIQLLGC